MCGRANLHDSYIVQLIMERAGLPSFPAREPRHNICPTEPLDVITMENKVEQQAWSIEFGKFRHPNTKVSTLKRRKDLQKMLMESRCVVPLNSFYEWPDPKERPEYAGISTRFNISTPDNVIFLAGISKNKDDGLKQFNILTTEPNETINHFHHRMPVWLDADQVNDFMKSDSLETLYEYLVPYKGKMKIYECDPYVNNGKHEGPKCMEQLRTWEQFQKENFGE